MSLVAEEKLSIPGPAGNLEAIWWPSTVKTGQVAVICHPHPLYGGTMENKVVTTLARAWRDAGFSVLRFNFRGTGASSGSHDGGRGEIDDLLAVLAWVQETQQPHRTDLAGFSFGAWVAAATVSRLPPGQIPERLVLVAPPVHYEGFDNLAPPPETLVLQGEDDDVVVPEDVYAWVASRPDVPELLRFPGAGHFFHGRLTELKEAVSSRL